MRVLVTNDDGIDAPGLRTLVAALSQAGLPPHVAAPDSERSASGHGITITGPLVAVPVAVDGAAEAYGVSGLPADTTMLALSDAGLFKVSTACARSHMYSLVDACAQGATPFDVVLSGINRGNNYGLHVVYSGTVAGAREAAAKGVPALALSLDSYRRDADYTACVAATLPLLRCLSKRPALRKSLAGCVLNVNFPCSGAPELKGYALTAQSYECTRPGFRPVDAPPGARAWMNSPAGGVNYDRTAGSDAAATALGFVSVTVITLLSHAPPVRACAPETQQQAAIPLGISDEAAEALLDAAAAAATAAGVGDVLARIGAAAPAEAS